MARKSDQDDFFYSETSEGAWDESIHPFTPNWLPVLDDDGDLEEFK